MKTRGCRKVVQPESGYTVLSVMIGIAVVSIALVGHALLAGYGALASRRARNDLGCRSAALAKLHDEVPAGDGGSLPPEAALEGWSDLVYFDRTTGSVVTVSGPGPAGAGLIARQWRRGRDGRGRRVVEVVATAVDPSGRPLAGASASSVTYSERVR